MELRILNKIIQKIIHTLGFDKNRLEDKPFYQISNSCQIPELSTLYELFLGKRSEGLFIEVGAYDGISFSNSSCLASAGWEGLLIEPIPEFAQACRTLYSGNQKIKILETAIGSTEKEVTITVAGSLTTTDESMITAYESIGWAKKSVRNTKKLIVKQRVLDDVLNEMNFNRIIDILIVDVEGKEKEVFDGFDILHWKPRMIIAELSHTHADLHKYSGEDSKLQQHIVDSGYSVIYKDQVNTVFLSERVF